MLVRKKSVVLAWFGIAILSVLIAAGQGAPAGQRGGQQAGGRGQRGAQDAAPVPTGLTVTGEVQNYVPVTDAMLRNPDPGDWLMIRRNYQGWSYSPLKEITKQNVADLELAWVWAMAEGGANQSHPLVHDGILYLLNRGARLTELLKQPQFSPLKMEEQVAVIYAGVNGYLDPIPVARVRAFEQGLLSLVRTKNGDILEDIRKSGDLSDATAGKLKGVVDGYAKTFA